MIRFLDAATLAYTKLRTHKIRTGITVGVAGILFGLILAIVFVTQGVFDSLARFSNEGLNDRAIVSVMHITPAYPVYEHMEDPEFIALVEAKHRQIVNTKTTAAKEHGVEYIPERDDPSPIEVDTKTKKKRISEDAMQAKAVQEVAKELRQKNAVPFDIDEHLSKYASARVLTDNIPLIGDATDQMGYMKNGKDPALLTEQEKVEVQTGGSSEAPSLLITNQSISDPFINTSVKFDASKGDIPVIVPFKSAEKLLGLKKLSHDATTQAKYDRLQEVRDRIGEITAEFCYRNAASQQLLARAISQKEMQEDAGDAYVTPVLQYSLPATNSCDTPVVTTDARSDMQKQAEAARVRYEKEISEFIGEPVQYKVKVQVVGVAGDMPEGGSLVDVGGLVQSLLGSWLSYGEQWVIPADMMRQIPEDKLPAVLGMSLANNQGKSSFGLAVVEQYMVEFDDFEEARTFLRDSGAFGGQMSGDDTYVSPYGSSTLLVAEMKDWFAVALLWTLLVVGGIAVIIMSSIIGRTVSEGRRESAIFRAIGARRADIGSIYGMYALLLSVRVVLFAVILGVFLALVAEFLLSSQATLAARYAYAAADAQASFHFFSVVSWYVPCILAAILVSGIVASIIPVIRSARRNPIKDMRDDT